MLYSFIKYFILRPFIYLFLRPRIIGKENLKIQGPAIVVANHIHNLDPALIGSLVSRPVYYMAKKEIFESKWRDLFVRKGLNAFPIHRGYPDIKAMKHAIALLNEGKVFGIFPEGTRCVSGEMDILENGAAFFALKTGAKIVPVYVEPGTMKRFRVHMAVGDPMDANELVKRHPGMDVRVVTQAISDALQRLRLKTEAEFI